MNSARMEKSNYVEKVRGMEAKTTTKNLLSFSNLGTPENKVLICGNGTKEVFALHIPPPRVRIKELTLES